ncbi:MAG: hypothetical protein GEU99_14430 [Luteitalea sp.]|nr:hypothetical protein [Luteitalea sp.]
MTIPGLVRGLALSLVVLATVSAADISGTWKAEFTAPGGQTVENTFVFEVDGDTLTGTVSSEMAGESPIEEGTIDGDEISFAATRSIRGNEMRSHYEGKVDGDKIDLTVTVQGGDRSFDMTATREGTQA